MESHIAEIGVAPRRGRLPFGYLTMLPYKSLPNYGLYSLLGFYIFQ